MTDLATLRQHYLDAARRVAVVLEARGIKVQLVGSVARGDIHEGSDIDFLVLECPEELRYGIEADVEDILRGIPFDVIYLDEVRSEYFRKQMLKEGIDPLSDNQPTCQASPPQRPPSRRRPLAEEP